MRANMNVDKKQGDFYYRIEEKGISITGYDGKESELSLPRRIEERPVYKIAKKAFLSRKNLSEAVLPDTIEVLEEWAFAYCSNLEKVCFPKKKLSLGKGIFFSCWALREICCEERENGGAEKETGHISEKKGEHPWRLLGAAPVVMDAEYLLTPWEAEEEHWIEKWDAKLLALLQEEDEEGYSKVVLCGEEDLHVNLEEFIKEKRRKKARMALIRLGNPYRLKETMKEKLLAFVQEHTKGCESEATWEVVKLHGEERIYFEIFTETGCLTEENFDAVLEDIGQAYAEMKAYFMRYKEEHMKKEDFFDSLSLDF